MRTCWYCGTDETETIYEWEHQVPLGLGGTDINNVVDSCQPCNRLKGKRTVVQFRREIEARLGTRVTFAGEATADHAATDISTVRSFAADTGLVRLPEEILSEGRQVVMNLRSAGFTSATLGGLVTDAIRTYLDRLYTGEVSHDQLGPQILTLAGTVDGDDDTTRASAVG